MHRLTELFPPQPNGHQECQEDGSASKARILRVTVIEARVMAGDLFCYAFRQALPALQVDLVARLDEVRDDAQVLFYSFINRGCDLAAMAKALARLEERFPALPIVVVTDTAGEDVEAIMADHPLVRWLPASAGFNALVLALRHAAEMDGSGEQPLPSTRGTEASLPPKTTPLPLGLTVKEHAIIRYLHEGKSNKLIAHALDCSESTVKVHIANMMRKLRLHNRTQLALVYQGEGQDQPAEGDRRSVDRVSASRGNGAAMAPN